MSNGWLFRHCSMTFLSITQSVKCHKAGVHLNIVWEYLASRSYYNAFAHVSGYLVKPLGTLHLQHLAAVLIHSDLQKLNAWFIFCLTRINTSANWINGNAVENATHFRYGHGKKFCLLIIGWCWEDFPYFPFLTLSFLSSSVSPVGQAESKIKSPLPIPGQTSNTLIQHSAPDNIMWSALAIVHRIIDSSNHSRAKRGHRSLQQWVYRSKFLLTLTIKSLLSHHILKTAFLILFFFFLL